MALSIGFSVSPLLSEPFTGYEADVFPYPTPPLALQPAGYAFSIWAVIYLWLIVAAVFGFLSRRLDGAWDATRLPLILSLGPGTFWIAIALASPIWATIGIFIMLATALWAMSLAPKTDRLWLATPLGLYAGWLTAAAFVSAATTLAGYTAVSGQAASFIGLFGVLTVGILALLRRPPLGYGIALAWALIGVTVSALTRGDQAVLVALSACAVIVISVWAGRQALSRARN